MEVVLYNSNVCRLCGEENDNGNLLYSCEQNNQNLSEVINTYLPIKVADDGQLPRTICPGCTIQLEATVEFLTLIINGQKVIRELHLREKEYNKRTILNSPTEQEIVTDKIIYEVNTSDGVYQVEHPISLQVAGLQKPKRKRGRPPKKPKTPEELAKEAAAKEQETKHVKNQEREYEPGSGKRRRKTPTRFREAVQGKELERIFKEEGVIDGEESEPDAKTEPHLDLKPPVPKEPEVIGHLEDSGELVVVVKGKGRGRPKGPMTPTRKECAICGMEFTCTGRYMSHVAQHGPVLYQCGQCSETFTTRLHFNNHQKELGHTGQNIIPCKKNVERIRAKKSDKQRTESLVIPDDPQPQTMKSDTVQILENVILPITTALPDLNPQPILIENDVNGPEFLKTPSPTVDVTSSPSDDSVVKIVDSTTDPVIEKSDDVEQVGTTPSGKPRLKCNHCDKTFSSKQSKSLHIKATHQGERPYACGECGARFAYPRSLALHAVSHRRRAGGSAKGYACDLCGKVLNHPSSVVYHKEAEHAGQRYVCNKCGKSFKHKQLLQRHQLVHSQDRPFNCKLCSASFKTKANLLNHSLLHTGVKKFSCEICKHKFAHKTSLTLHMRWHTGQKPYSCNVCGKSFSQKGNLSEHERIHTGEKPFQCSLCPRRFTTSSQHRLHARRHNPERPYACAHCGKRFVSRGSWAAHVRREGGGRTHRCGECGRTFAERWPLLKHLRKHSGERPFRCPHCPRAFADCSNLNKHKKQVHKQISLLATANQQAVPSPIPLKIEQPVSPLIQLEEQTVSLPETSPGKLLEEATEDELEERVIYVTYDVDDAESPAFHILDPEQAASLEEDKVLTTCELYSGPSLLVPQPEYEQLELEHEQLQLQNEQLEQEELQQLPEEMVLEGHDQNMPVTDEQGNPLHFTMQDGTRLAITSADGKSLQVITHDGQRIPVEINGYADEEEVDNPDTIVHQLNLQKSIDSNVSSPVTHYFTIV